MSLAKSQETELPVECKGEGQGGESLVKTEDGRPNQDGIYEAQEMGPGERLHEGGGGSMPG